MSTKRIHLTESQLMLCEEHFCAGTDRPYYSNEDTGEVYEATWNGDYGMPFGYWPTDYSGDEQFVVGEPWTTHGDACGQCAQQYVTDLLSERIGGQASEISNAMEDLAQWFNDSGFKYNEETDLYVSADGSEEKDSYDFGDFVNDSIDSEAVDAREYIEELVESFLEGNGIPDSGDIEKHLYDMVGDNFDFTTTRGTTDALASVGEDFWDYFERGHSEGRIWPNREMIGFYESEQPDPNMLEDILWELQSNQRFKNECGLTVEQMLQFHMVFEDWRSGDGTITACTIQDYIDGNYGPESYEDEDDEDIQYNNGQKTVFVPHLANQSQKREFFKDFRNTRDKAVYAPRERGAGTLAQYHALRYPYGENKEYNKRGVN